MFIADNQHIRSVIPPVLEFVCLFILDKLRVHVSHQCFAQILSLILLFPNILSLNHRQPRPHGYNPTRTFWYQLPSKFVAKDADKGHFQGVTV